MLKYQFHTHTAGDTIDYIPHSPKELITKAAELKYNVLSITCHNKVLFTEELKNFAEQKGILLIPGIELNIGKKHVLILNADKDIEKVKNYGELKNYKNSFPSSLLVAPHPFFPGTHSLKKELIEHIDLFDAIEYSAFYTKTKNYNKKALKISKKYNKPLIASSDCHILKNLDLAYTLVESPKNIEAVISAIKKNKIINYSLPLSYFKVGKTVSHQMLRNLLHSTNFKKPIK